MNFVGDVLAWFGDGTNWTGRNGVPERVLEHLQYTGTALLVVLLVAVPLGAVVGHTGRGSFLVVGLGNALRALPTLALLIVLALAIGLGVLPPTIALVVLGIPSVLAGTYAGIRAVDPAVVDAARGMGMTERDVLLRVELPNALPLVLGGVRSAALQLVSTATVAAYVSLGGLGRYIIDGQAVSDYTRMLAGAVLVAALAVLVDLLLAGVQRLVVSRGVRLAGAPS